MFIDRRYADLIDLIEPNLPALVRAANRNFLTQRWNDALRQAPPHRFDFAVTIIGGELAIPPRWPQFAKDTLTKRPSSWQSASASRRMCKTTCKTCS